MNKLVKTDVEGYQIDPMSRAVINTQTKEYQEFLQNRSFELRVKTLENDISTVREDISEIKGLLKHLVS